MGAVSRLYLASRLWLALLTELLKLLLALVNRLLHFARIVLGLRDPVEDGLDLRDEVLQQRIGIVVQVEFPPSLVQNAPRH
jgi:hypothetical protein